MARTVAIGEQDFEELILRNDFYVDKTLFIKEWWESDDKVTLITRPRRFGKTLNMHMLERFFDIEHEGNGEVFQNLFIWKEEKYRKMLGTYPVIFLSFAGVKEVSYDMAVYRICFFLQELYIKNYKILDSDVLTEGEKRQYKKLADGISVEDAPTALYRLSNYLYRYYGKKVIILLDEYDTPMQEAYVSGYWREIVAFTRTLFNNTFKTNPYLERAMMTGITRVSKESLFLDLNNLKVITMTSNQYSSCFGFTEEEVFAAMDEFGMASQQPRCKQRGIKRDALQSSGVLTQNRNKDEVKKWYDGFTIGDLQDVYNPWSVICFLDNKQLKPYWANTSSNGLISSLLRKGNRNIKMQFEKLLQGQTIIEEIDEEVIFEQLDRDENAIWSLLLASGYLKVIGIQKGSYELELTNYEVRKVFGSMVRNWFGRDSANYNDFIKSLLAGDIGAMNDYMTEVADSMFSFFDGGSKPSSRTAPERFYHGFVLGLLVDLTGRYVVTSNKESGFGRYDVMLKPLNQNDDGIILEFKIYDPKKEASMEETVQAALKQIEERKYEQILLSEGITKDHIRKYGFAFKGKAVLIG